MLNLRAALAVTALFFSTVVVGCGGSSTSPPSNPTPKPTPTSKTTPTPSPTSTPKPTPTPTIKPTPTPTPTTSPGGRETVIYNFKYGHSGAAPQGPLISDAQGALLGTTAFSGAHNNGTVYRLLPGNRASKLTVLYAFKGGSDGAAPEGGLLANASGSLFGTTVSGGIPSCSSGCGTVYELTPTGSGYTEAILYRFKGGSDGEQPRSTLVADAAGTLYGTAYGGSTACSDGCGVVFALTPTSSGYAERVIYRFQGGADGSTPSTALLILGSVIYGTTAGGGNSTCAFFGQSGCGTVFALTPVHSGFAKSAIYNFQGVATGDGAGPLEGVIADPIGDLYGTTVFGGVAQCGLDSSDCGTVFKLSRSGSGYTESILYRFMGHSDGFSPSANLAIDGKGVLYGTTSEGGQGLCSPDGGCGTVFTLAPSGSRYAETILHRFLGPPTDGELPGVGVLVEASGVLYGTAGGGTSAGVAYRVMPF